MAAAVDGLKRTIVCSWLISRLLHLEIWLLLLLMLFGARQLRAQEEAVIRLEPETLKLSQGQKSGIEIRIENAANVYGLQIALFFDAEKIKLLDHDPAKPGIQVRAGDFLPSDEGFMVVNEVDNEAGKLTYALTLLAPAEPASGSGTLIAFEVEALQAGTSDLLLDTVILASAKGSLLPVRLGDGAADPGGDQEPAATAKQTALAAAPVTEVVLATETPRRHLFPVLSTGADLTAAGARKEGLAARSTRPSPTAATPTLATANHMATSTVTIQTPVGSSAAAVVYPTTRGGDDMRQATGIAAAPATKTQDDVPAAAGLPAPALTVIGQQSVKAERKAQTPALTDNARNLEPISGLIIVSGLVIVLIFLIALWTMGQLLSKR
jgi:hypothetical protein